jgi:hypothetical protein
LEFIDVALYLFWVGLFKVDSEHLGAGVMFVLKADKFRDFLYTWTAPGGPKVNDDPSIAVIRQNMCFSREVCEFEVDKVAPAGAGVRRKAPAQANSDSDPAG